MQSCYNADMSEMSNTWACPYEVDQVCKRRRKVCRPGAPGCVLYHRVKFYSFKPLPTVSGPRHDPAPGPLARKLRRAATDDDADQAL